LLTGADGGIGRVLAPLLAQRGARLVLTGLGKDALIDQAAELGGQAVPWSLGSAADAEALAAAAGPVDAVVHGAGLGHRGPVAEMTAAQVERLVAINLTVPLALTRALLPPMLGAGHGHVCFVGSIAGMVAVADESAYAAAKGGLALFADSLRLEVAPAGVEVSLVAPAAVATDFFTHRGQAYHRQRPAPMPPERVAHAIVRALETGRPTTVVPGWMNVAVRLRGASPRGYDRLVARFDR
jgi:short-subunit dehydrogenase